MAEVHLNFTSMHFRHTFKIPAGAVKQHCFLSTRAASERDPVLRLGGRGADSCCPRDPMAQGLVASESHPSAPTPPPPLLHTLNHFLRLHPPSPYSVPTVCALPAGRANFGINLLSPLPRPGPFPPPPPRVCIFTASTLASWSLFAKCHKSSS